VKNIVQAVKTSVFVCSVAVLTACGGGGGSDTATAPPLNFPLLSAWQDSVKQSRSRNFTISGTCNGSGSNIVTPIQSASGTTQSVSGQGTPISYLRTGTLNLFYSNCEGSGSQDRIDYYDANYHPIQTEFPAENVPGLGPSQQFVVYRYNASIPAFIKTGDFLTIASMDVLRRNCFGSFVGANCTVTKEGGGDLSVRARSESSESIYVDFVSNIAIDGISQRVTLTSRLTFSGSLTPTEEVLEVGSVREVWRY
jgi:hypothetical protein